MAETSKSEEMSAKLHLDVHKYIQAMQSQHGVIPHQDYSQYRQYCTRKLSRLRHNHDLIKTNGRALLHGSGGRGKSASVYQPRRYFNKNVPSKGVSIQYTNLNDDDTDEEEEEDREDYSLVNHVNFLLVMLVHAERCWSAAMHVKSQYDAFAASPPPLPQGSRKAKTSLGKLRKQYLSKLCKASYYASALYSMAKAVADESTVIECHAYSTWMAGNHALETLDWSKATREYGTCLKFINALSESFAVSSDLEMADYFTARGEYTIQPLFKFCQYELSQSRGASSQLDMNEFLTSESLDQNTSSLLQSKLAEKRNESRRAQVSQVDSKYGKISYRKVDFFIDNEELRVLLCKIDEAKENDQDDAGFTKLLSFYDDAIAIVSKDLQALEQLASGKQVNASKHVQKCLKGYLDFQKLSTLMTRNEQIVNDMENQEIIDNNNKRLEDLAHMYSVLLQNAKEVAALPLADEASPNSGEDLEDEFALEANAHFLRFRAWKNFYSAHVYSRVGKHNEAHALLQHSAKLAEQAYEELAACELPQNVVASMIELQDRIESAQAIFKATAYLTAQSYDRKPSKPRFVVHRLDHYEAGKDASGNYNFYPIPPPQEYVACKPAFFDIAQNFVTETPDLKPLIDAHQKKSGGLFSWFRG